MTNLYNIYKIHYIYAYFDSHRLKFIAKSIDLSNST